MFQVKLEFFQPVGKEFGTRNRTQICIEKKALVIVRHILRKQDFCLGKNKEADQLCSNCTTDQHVSYMDSMFRLLFISKI